MNYSYHKIGNDNGVYDIDISNYQIPIEWIKNRTILDAGCATGFFSSYFINQGAKSVLAVDAAPEGAEIYFSSLAPKLTILKKDLMDLKWESLFDFVFFSSVFLHLKHPTKVLENLYSALKPNGNFQICTPLYDSDLPIMYCSPPILPIPGAEKTADIAGLWSPSQSAMLNILTTVGFKSPRYSHSFMLTQTPFGREHNLGGDSKHGVWIATK